jgi:hypothetical protein
MRKFLLAACLAVATLPALAQQNTNPQRTDPISAVAKENTAKSTNIIQEKLKLEYPVLGSVQQKQFELETEYLNKAAKANTLNDKLTLQKNMKEKRRTEFSKLIPADKMPMFSHMEQNAANLEFSKMTAQEQAAVKALGGAEKVLGWDLTVIKM